LDQQRKYVYGRLGEADGQVIASSGIGEDAAVVASGGRYLVAHVDPITDAVNHIGKIAVQVSSNDVAVKGAKPRWSLVTILLPELDEMVLDEITRDIDDASRRLGIAVVGGHTEVTASVRSPVVIISQFGYADSFLDVKAVRPGQAVIFINTAGIEGTAVLAWDAERLLLAKGVPMTVVDSAKGYLDKLSVIEDALALVGLGAVSMHDPTEGGVIAALTEMALASGTVIEVRRDLIPVAPETRVICSALGLDPLKLLGSGSIVATFPPQAVEGVLRSFGGRASFIGTVREPSKGERGGKLVVKEGEGAAGQTGTGEVAPAGEEEYLEPPQDEILSLEDEIRG